jgi:hypothetical protein
MERAPVRSSNVYSVGYDPARRILEVEFQDGSVYQYYGVPRDVYLDLVNAPSVGSFLARFIKDEYNYEQIG